MALESSDVFVVQKQSGGKEIYKTTLESIGSYLNTQGGITYRGTIDLTQVPGGQLDPATPENGDLYINTGDGVAAAGYGASRPAIPSATAIGSSMSTALMV